MTFGIELMRIAFMGQPDDNKYLLGTGYQSFGECGLGNAYYPNFGNPYVQQMPMQYVFTSPGYIDVNTRIKDPDRWKNMFATYQHVVAVKGDGTLWATGDNSFGQIGDGNTGNPQRWFKQILVTDGINASWVMGGGGTEHSAALRNDGRIFCWGRNDISAACGNGKKEGNVLSPWNIHDTDAAHRMFPLSTTFIDLRVGHRFNIGMDQDRNIWSWGNNGSRQLGREFNNTAGDASPNATQDTYIRRLPTFGYGGGETLIQGPWADFSAGAYHAGAIRQSDNALFMWGLPGNGQLGAPPNDAGRPNDPRQVPVPVVGRKWARLFCGEYSTAALLDDGTAWVWGKNDSSQLGVSGSPTTPTQLPGNWKFVQLGLKSGAGIQTDGSLWVWGSNQNGLIGLGSGVNSSPTPTRVGSETSWVEAYPMNLSTIAIKRA
jgi:alpha-tubulin suppressor-like RCC1 family protein